MMDRIAREAEASEAYAVTRISEVDTETAQDVITEVACTVGNTLGVSAIVCFTKTGNSAIRVARNRPKGVILALTPDPNTCDQLALCWGVVPFQTEDPQNTDDMARIAHGVLKKSGLADINDRYVITAGVPFGLQGSTNMMRVEKLTEEYKSL